ncbi:hypothetical protein FOL47_008111 [Perkinsus chesapeaki]|uniref:Uncharacterized protein n=1 Tax=Perkinsus chesapeaki TaxID=330153 RepID=A0A7J6LHB1_PERCH|nr:hypothetical protein FOL47_008111 [Perkinsus chesapeaki]
MRFGYVAAIASVFSQLAVGVTPPSGDYCGSYKHSLVNLSKAKVNFKNGDVFDILVTASILAGGPKDAQQTEVSYTFDVSSGKISVTDVTKVQSLLKDLGAEAFAPLVTKAFLEFSYDGSALSSGLAPGFKLTKDAC